MKRCRHTHTYKYLYACIRMDTCPHPHLSKYCVHNYDTCNVRSIRCVKSPMPH